MSRRSQAIPPGTRPPSRRLATVLAASAAAAAAAPAPVDQTARLTMEELTLVMSHVYDGTIGAACRTNRAMAAICRDEELWRELCVNAGYMMTKPALRSWFHQYVRNARPAHAARIDRALEDATIGNRHNEVVALLAVGADVHTGEFAPEAPLFWATSAGNVPMTLALLAAGADPLVNGGDMLNNAADNASPAIIQTLLDAAAARGGYTAQVLGGAVIAALDSRRRHLGVVRILIGAGADVRMDDDAALRIAARGGMWAHVRELITAVATRGGYPAAVLRAVRAETVDHDLRRFFDRVIATAPDA